MTWFGFQIPAFNLEAPQMFEGTVTLARAAEDSGFASVWVMDHFWQLPPLGGPDAPILEGYTLLGALAARTSRVRLGTLVTGVTYRNPALVAKMCTTLDVISGGRAICGIGAAWYEPEHIGLGFDFPPAGERLSRLDEAVQIIRMMFREEKPSFGGKYYRIAEARNVPRPLQAGGPPIMIGGGGEKRTLRIAAKHADMTNWIGTPEVLAHKIDVLRAHCEDLGRDPAEITVTRLATLILTDSDEASKQARAMLTAAVGEDGARAFVVGQDDEVVDQVAEAAKAGVEGFIFNMPVSNAETVVRAGELLNKHFS